MLAVWKLTYSVYSYVLSHRGSSKHLSGVLLVRSFHLNHRGCYSALHSHETFSSAFLLQLIKVPGFFLYDGKFVIQTFVIETE